MKHVVITFCMLYFFSSLSAQNKPPFSTFMSSDCLLGLTSSNKIEVLPAKYSSISFMEIGNDWLITTSVQGQPYYFLYQGNKTIPLNYTEVEKINDRLLKVGEAGAYGLINSEGKGLLLLNNQALFSAGSTAVIFLQKGTYGVVDLDGKIIIPNNYEKIQHWEAGGFWVNYKNQVQLLDAQGKFVPDALYDSIRNSTSNLPVCAVSTLGKWGVINGQHQKVVSFDYVDVKLFPSGVIAVLDMQKQWHLLNLKGEKISNNTFDSVKDINGIAILVSQGGKTDLLDNKGAVLLENINSPIDYLGGDWVSIKEKSIVRVFSINKNRFLEKEFEAIKFGEEGAIWSGILFQQDKKWGWINFDEQIIIKPTYTTVSPYLGEFVLVTSEKNEVGLISIKGQSILPTEYKVITPKQSFYKVKKENSDWFYVDKNNQKLNCMLY